MNERRIARLREQIKQTLAQVLLRDLADPKLGMVTITRIELDSEFTQCKAYWSVFGDEKQQKDSNAALRRARGLCQRAIGKAVRARSMPHLEFVFDQGIGGAIRLNTLIDELAAERKRNEAERGDQAETPSDADSPEGDSSS
ncbi:MAG: ribosome-binding factor RbfA [Planctomycetota bacterium]|jgi:ribosome-binding factor A